MYGRGVWAWFAVSRFVMIRFVAQRELSKKCFDSCRLQVRGVGASDAERFARRFIAFSWALREEQ